MIPTVLVVDDDRSIRDSLVRGLGLEGFAVKAAADGETALDLFGSADILVLDLGLPGIDGIEVIRRIRGDGGEVPICVLSARDEVEDRVRGLETGADDYLVKPFALAELVARLNALLRRRGEAEPLVLTVGDLRMDVARRRVERAGVAVELTRREFELLRVLALNAGIVMGRDRLLELVWGYDFEVNTNVVDVFVGYLRKKLGSEPMIHTVRGVGFVMRP
ncbi:MAG: response regulator transcription factor [Acidimicrobiia bacterium]